MYASLNELRRVAILSVLRGCKLFNDPPLENLDEIAALTEVKPLAKGEYLLHQGMASEGLYVVQRGAVKVFRTGCSGKEQVIHVFRPGESFGEETLVLEQGYPAEARAIEESQVLVVRKTGLVALVKRQPDLALRILRAMERHLRLLVGLLDDLKLKDIKTRVVNWLLRQCPNPRSREPFIIQLPTTKRMLASELGTVSETLSRTLAKLRNLRLLTLDGTTITLLCPLRLAQWVDGASTALPLPARTLQPSTPAWSPRMGSDLFYDRAGRFSVVLAKADAIPA
jgi:CRP/FNR family transcriptional regulator, dissimilatory nitrate respiration regulator